MKLLCVQMFWWTDHFYRFKTMESVIKLPRRNSFLKRTLLKILLFPRIKMIVIEKKMLGHEFIPTCHFWKCIYCNTNERFYFSIIVQGKIQLPLKGLNRIFNILNFIFKGTERIFLKKAIKCFLFYLWHLHFQSGTLFSPQCSY